MQKKWQRTFAVVKLLTRVSATSSLFLEPDCPCRMSAPLDSAVIDPFLKPWVQECMTSMPNILSRHKIEVGPTHDTLVKMPSSEAFDLVYIDVNKNVLAENVIIMADSTLYSGIPFTLSEPRCLVLSESKKRSNTTKDSYLSTVSFGYFIVSCASQSCPWIQSTSPKKWQIRTVQQSYGKMGIFEDIDEEHDDAPEEINEAIYVKTINGKTLLRKILQKHDSSCHVGRS